MSFPKYPETALLAARPEIFRVKEVVATEKIHGSNFRVHFPAGMSSLDDVGFGSRDVELDPSSDVKFPLPHAVEWFRSRPELLLKMWEVLKSYGFPDATVFGEAHGPGVNVKGVRYSNGSDSLFRAFDIMVGENFVTYDLFVHIADEMGLQRVPEVWRGDPTQENLDGLLNRPSVAAAENGVDDLSNLAEGIVVRSNPLFRDVFGKWIIAKHKGTKFVEIAHVPAVKKERGASPADVFAETYVTEGRIANAWERLQSRGATLTESMRDMPILIDELVADLRKEASAEWPDGVSDKQMSGCVSRVAGPLFRKFLAQD